MYFDAKEFGKRLHDIRTSRGITQEELAVRLGLASKQHVSRMENGERSCSIDLLIELSCILHVSTDYLLMGSEPSKEEVKNDLLSIISELSTIAKKIYKAFCRSASITCLVGKPTGYLFDLNQTIQSTGKVRTNSIENNIQHRCKYCLDMWTIVLEMLL